MKQVNCEGRRQLLLAIAERYKQAEREARRAILDEFVAITGYHRKHAIRVLATTQTKALSVRRRRLRLYDEAVRQALVVLWEASDRLCGKRLKPLIPVLLDALQRHGHLLLDRDVQRRVLAVSAADPLLSMLQRVTQQLMEVEATPREGRRTASRRASALFGAWQLGVFTNRPAASFQNRAYQTVPRFVPRLCGWYGRCFIQPLFVRPWPFSNLPLPLTPCNCIYQARPARLERGPTA